MRARTPGAAARAGRAAALAVAIVSTGARVEAQEVRLTLSGGRLVDERGEGRGGASAGVSLRRGGSEGEVGTSLQAAVLGEQAYGSGGAWGRVAVARAGPVALIAEGQGGAGAARGYGVGAAEASPRLQLRGAALALEAGPHLAIGAERRASTGPGGLLAIPRAGSARVVRRERGVTAALSATRGSSTLAGGWRAARTGTVRWMEWSGGATVQLGRASLGARAGTRSGGVEERWAAAHLGVTVAQNAAMVVDAGRTPSAPVAGRPGGQYASAGLVLRVGGRR